MGAEKKKRKVNGENAKTEKKKREVNGENEKTVLKAAREEEMQQRTMAKGHPWPLKPLCPNMVHHTYVSWNERARNNYFVIYYCRYNIIVY